MVKDLHFCASLKLLKIKNLCVEINKVRAVYHNKELHMFVRRKQTSGC